MVDLSVTPRDPEPPNISYWVPKYQGTGDFKFMRSECVKLVLVSFTLIYTLSAACALVLSSYINVCVTSTCAS